LHRENYPLEFAGQIPVIVQTGCGILCFTDVEAFSRSIEKAINRHVKFHAFNLTNNLGLVNRYSDMLCCGNEKRQRSRPWPDGRRQAKEILPPRASTAEKTA
jgi:hypothetical protein